MQPNLDAPPTVEAELAALRRLLDFGEGLFSSSIAVCNSPVERDRLITQVRETHPGVAVVAIPARTVDVFGFAIEGYTGPPKALCLIGLEASIASQEADSHTLRSLNASRDLWPNRYPCPIVLWLPEYAATALSQQARDYWRFISHRFYFATESPMLTPRANVTYADKYLNAISLSGDEKIARIEELKSRIESAGANPVPALLQHVMVWWDELAVLYQFAGDLDESLRIRREIELPVYKRLGDVRESALTMGQTADIFEQRGEIDEALRIYREEQLPAFERLGDIRAKAVTLVRIAGILMQRGEIHEVIRIYREIMPPLERIGDMHSLIICRHNLGSALLSRGYKKDIPAAREHLRWALAMAETHNYAEAAQIRETVTRLLGGR